MVLLLPLVFGIGIWFLPERLWEKLLKIRYIKIFKSNSLVAKGKRTWSWVQTGEGDWPDYKFYGSLLRELQSLSRLYGATPKASLERIKRPLLQDIRFETKLREIRLGGMTQFLAMALMTWTFMILSRLILGREFNALLCFGILSMQLVGAGIYLWLESIARTKTFHGFDSAYEGIVALQALMPLGLSLKEKREKSEIDQFLSYKNLKPELERVRRSLLGLLSQWKDFGRPIEAGLADLVDDVRFAQEIAQASLLKRMDALKFLIAALFFLSAYLVDLLVLVNSFFTVE